ncbi:RNA polymerase recycling motor HelD [Aureibacillus halotolerans]|uniref:Rep family ATP-dependent DNA helicase n=1 Tax=Aureibacillus halotolerans TaxID=1508390 RepID=A0A4R6U676_9BACI|nr:RNA polymerase recycling motor HelD [Aureibacillus halotolerans]TDQ42010.1 Rep family ATP-dependent DNA helicase [Aureibacillus halotolerans]
MSEKHHPSIVAEEQAKLEEILTEISQQHKRLYEELEAYRSDIQMDRKHFWEGLSIDNTSWESKLETSVEIRSKAVELKGLEDEYHKRKNEYLTLERQKNTPYFCRVDFQYDQSPSIESIYIGAAALRDEEGDLHIFDWRAPISNLFYNTVSLGEASFEAPSGTIHGNVHLKRQMEIKDGQLKRVFDTDVTVGDSMLEQMASDATDTKMKTIVATIQKEQNDIIRDDLKKTLLINGVAGSGKTSIALQRVAYLLYTYKDKLSHADFLLLTPNGVFRDYLSNVLPQLGEENIRQLMLYDVMRQLAGPKVRIQHPYDYLEDLHSKKTAPSRVADRKAELAFMKLIDQYINKLNDEGLRFKSLSIETKLLFSEEQLRTLYYDGKGKMPHHERILFLKKQLLKKLSGMEESVRKKRYQRLISSNTYIGEEEELQKRSRQSAKRLFKRINKQVTNLEFLDFYQTYVDLFSNPMEGNDWDDISRESTAELKNGYIPFEDAAAFIYLKNALLDRQSFRERQLMIDEMQDYSPAQLYMLIHYFPRAQFTLFGDVQQAVYKYPEQATSYDQYKRLLGEDINISELHKSYRSTKHIVDFAANLLPSAIKMDAVDRPGEMPEIQRFSSREEWRDKIASTLQAWSDSNVRRVAIITKHEKQALEVYQALNTHIDVELVSRHSSAMNKNVIVIPSYMSKGLEFEGVIVADAGKDYYKGDADQHLLYTMCTRPLHRLLLLHQSDIAFPVFK